ncbi:glycosyltransferase [Coraliomargarita algicola]|uniref:Glycosyltransferase n=1 Tax=Coraliomargarita algicola TaxID=3092156 RepID=A0ABZ0RQ22_9BACT|nr:glycosyltransferase [Coraliomargarita sp. J2-16]WPJ95014.1 glycosyltransferase [Coraliomargarita sp. J2-16]
MRLKLFITNDAYLPGFRFGGPVRSLANLVDWLGATYEIYIFTKDRDLGDSRGYPEIPANQWLQRENVRVFYASPEQHTAQRAGIELASIQPDVVYLNGLWEGMTRGLLKSRLPSARYVIAPRGALGAGALAIKPWKKKLGLLLMRGSLKNLVWHATADSEVTEVRQVIGPDETVYLASNLLERRVANAVELLPAERAAGPIRFVSFSRLSRKKNFDYLLRCLQAVRGPFSLDIIGPEEDPVYTEELNDLAGQLATDQVVRFLGGKSPAELQALLPSYDFFALPTQHENFGHVFVEAWAAGLPVIISDQTPWRDLESKGIGWDIALSDTQRWRNVLEHCIQISSEEIHKMKLNAAQFASALALNQPIDSYQRIFEG